MKRIFTVIAVSGLLAATGPALAFASEMPSDSPNWQASHRLTCTAFQKMDNASQSKALDNIRDQAQVHADSISNDKNVVTTEYGLISQASLKDAHNACGHYNQRSVITALRKWYNSSNM